MKTSAGGIRAAALCTLFAVVAFAFILPGGTLDACGARSSFTGLQLVTHTAPSFEAPAGSRVAADSLVDLCAGDPRGWLNRRGPIEATFALVAAILGFVLAALRTERGLGWCAATGLIAMLTPLLFWNMFAASPDPHIGYWVALLAFATAAASFFPGLIRLVRPKRPTRAEGDAVWGSYRDKPFRR